MSREETGLQRGDLSNAPSPTLVIVFEGAIGTLPEKDAKRHGRLMEKEKWWQAAALWEINEVVAAKLLDLHHRSSYNVSAVTWLDPYMAMAFGDRMDDEGIPLRNVFYSTPQRLVRALPYNPDIVCVYDPDPQHVLTYGAKGVYLTDPSQIGRVFHG